MTELVHKKARKEAEKLLDICWDGKFPVALRPISDELNTQIYHADLGNKLSGVVSKDKGEPAKIVLNSRHVQRRRRFTWAHELGHVVERKVIANDNEYSFEELTHDHRYDLHEFFADEFAGALLMPSHKVSILHQREISVEELANYFNVPIVAVKKRLERIAKNPQ